MDDGPVIANLDDGPQGLDKRHVNDETWPAKVNEDVDEATNEDEVAESV